MQPQLGVKIPYIKKRVGCVCKLCIRYDICIYFVEDYFNSLQIFCAHNSYDYDANYISTKNVLGSDSLVSL